MIYFEADDGRILLVYDYLGRALVGSTDIPAADPDDVRCDDDEIDYFLDSLRALLPGLAFDRAPDRLRLQRHPPVAGVRRRDPRPDQPRPLHARPPSPTTSRPFPIVSLVGGKWTTFRGFAEEVADAILARLGRGRARLDPRPRHRRRQGLPHHARRAGRLACRRRPRNRPARSPPRPAAGALRRDRARRRAAPRPLDRRRPPARRPATTAARRSTGSREASWSSASPTS